jgi:Fe-S oxidoreductase
MKRWLGIARERSLPTIQRQTLRRWFRRDFRSRRTTYIRTVYLFCDEFTDYNDTQIGIKAVELLDRLGYEVKLVDHPESGRAALSKGLLPRAKRLAEAQVHTFRKLINSDTPLVGIEPSGILSFRDEYPRLVDKDLQADANALAPHCLLIDELLSRDAQAGLLDSSAFTQAKRRILLHGHCHQKALASVEDTVWALSLIPNYSVEVIPSGCCGMAGSFGYEAEHYALSQQVGEEVLFPAVRAAAADTLIVAPGTSCRHQLADGVGRQALHPVEVLWEGLRGRMGE